MSQCAPAALQPVRCYPQGPRHGPEFCTGRHKHTLFRPALGICHRCSDRSPPLPTHTHSSCRNRCLPRLWSTLRPLTLAGRRRPLHTKGHLRRCPCILRRTSTRTCPLRNHSKLLPMTTSILPVHIGLPRTGSRYKLCSLHHPFHRGCACRQHSSRVDHTARISQYFSAPNTGIAYLRIADEIRQKRDFNIAEVRKTHIQYKTL